MGFAQHGPQRDSMRIRWMIHFHQISVRFIRYKNRHQIVMKRGLVHAGEVGQEAGVVLAAVLQLVQHLSEDRELEACACAA